MEGLFDDFDDEILSNSDNSNNVSQQIIETEDKPKIKEWLLDNIICKYGTPFKCDEGNDIEYTFESDGLHCNLKFNVQDAKFMNSIPDYVKINKITCNTVEFADFINLPKEIDGTLNIKGCKEKDLNVQLPEKLGVLSLINCKIRSLKGLSNTCKSIEHLCIENCNMFTSFNGIPDNVGFIQLIKCKKIVDLEGIPDTVERIVLVSLPSFESLKGCPNKLSNGLYIQECPYLTTLAYCPSLIMDQCEIHDCMLYQLDMKNTRICGTFKLSNNNLSDLENGPKQIDGSYIVSEPYLAKFKANETIMTNAYNNAEFIYQVRKKYFKGNKNDMPQMNNGVKIVCQYLEDL